MSVGDRLGTSSTQDYVLLAALALGGYVLYKVFGAVSATVHAAGDAAVAVGKGVSTAYTATVNAVGSGLYTLFGPEDIGSSTYFLVNFPNGSRHAVPGKMVSSAGLFTWTGYPAGSEPPIVLTLVKDAQKQWYATSETPMAMGPAGLQPVTIDQTLLDVPQINFGRGQWR
jgi:hypothetical protein